MPILDLKTGFIPVGSIVAHLKSFTGVTNLASEFAECDGSIINDSRSPLNGQTLPNLNGNNRFIRGNSISGGIGGAETHNHVWNLNCGSFDAAASDQGAADCTSPTSSSSSLIPPYYDVVWIMRIR